jgi:hypothetical protein
VVTAPDIPGHRVGGVPGAGGFATGSRVYRCLANETGHEPATSQFRR